MVLSHWIHYAFTRAPDDEGGGGGDAAAARVAAATPPSAGGTLAGGDQEPGEGGLSAESGGDDVKPVWPENWRELMSGGDAKELKRLGMMNDPTKVWESYRQQEKRYSQIEPALKAPEPLGESATDAEKEAYGKELSTYREKAGIPETWEGYLDNLPQGLVVADEDKPILESFLQSEHGQNARPADVQRAIGWYYAEQEARMAALAESDAEGRVAAEEKMREMWGNEYRPNLNIMSSWLDTAPEGLKASLLNGRTADGVPIGDDPKIVDWLVSLAKAANPTGIILPKGNDGMVGAEQRLGELKKLRMEDPGAFYKNEDLMKEERDLMAYVDQVKENAA